MPSFAPLRQAARSLARRPGFTTTAVLLLTLGIGASTALFSLVETALLRKLPWPEPERLVAAWEISQRGNEMASAWGNFLDWRQTPRLESLAAYGTQQGTVLGGDRPTLAQVSSVSEDFFRTLGIVPTLGRLTRPEDHQVGGELVVVVSRGFFERQLGGDPGALGKRRLEAFGGSGTVVGVVDDALAFPEGNEVWIPLEPFDPQPYRTAHNFQLVGRLAPGVSLAAAEAELDGMTKAISSDEPKDYLPAGARLRSLAAQIRGPVERPLWVLLGATLLVLLVACSNLAAGLLARQAERRAELSLRASLGASRLRLLAEPVAESLILAFAGGGLGLILASALSEILAATAPVALPRASDVGINPQVLLFAAALTLLTALVFGVAPALAELGRRDGSPIGRRSTSSRAELKGWSVLIAAEVALTLLLLVGAGLMLRTLTALWNAPLGFRTAQVASVALELPQPRFSGDREIVTYHQRVLAAVSELPGVATAAFTSAPPLAGFVPNGQMGLRGGASEVIDSAGYHAVGGSYFETLGIPLLAGRTFNAADRAESEFVVVVNRSFAEAAWPGKEALGKRVHAQGMDQFWETDTWATVVGVVADARLHSFTREAGPQAFFPVAQRPRRGTSGVLLVATEGPPEATFAALERAVEGIDSQVPLRLGTLEEDAARTLGTQRFAFRLLGAFAGVALLLAGIGIAGVVSYAVARRRRELGLRLALGSPPGDAERLVLRGQLKVVGVGLAVGLTLCLGLTPLLGKLLWGIEPTDPATLASSLLLLLGAASLAAYLPARRAARIDPAEVLRGES